MKKILLFTLGTFLLTFLSYTETIKFKSGKIIEADILDRSGEYIKVDISGIPITYYLSEIESIDGITPSKEKEETRLPQTTAIDSSSNGIDIAHIRRILKELRYPEHTWPDIERELTAFLAKIDFPRLKRQAARVKSNPSQLKDFISGIGELIKQEGYLNVQVPQPLAKLLINNLSNDDIFNVIETSPIGVKGKEDLRYSLVSCSAIAQLGSIVLDLMGDGS